MKGLKRSMTVMGLAALPLVGGAALPEFDAATVTGDELLQAVVEQETKLTGEEFAELGRLLKGRELTFHNLALVGFAGVAGIAGRSQGCAVHLCAADEAERNFSVSNGRFFITATFTDAKDVRFAQRLWGSTLTMIKEVTGVVTEGNSMFSLRNGDELTLEATALVPKVPIEELPDFDAATVTGDELSKICRGLKRGVTDTIYRDLNALLLDRELSFGGDVEVIEVIEQEDGFADLVCSVDAPMRMSPGMGKSSCLCLMARVATRDIDALPWGFAGGSKIARLSGRVVEPFGRDRFGWREKGLPLADVRVEVAWKAEKLPEFDAATITGDELVELLKGLKSPNWNAQFERICRAVQGRRLTFSAGVVQGVFFSPSRKKNTIVRIGLGAPAKPQVPDLIKAARAGRHDLLTGKARCPVEIEAELPEDEGAQIAEQLTQGHALTNISGVFALNAVEPNVSQVRNGLHRWHRLTEVEFDADAPVPLPEFDAATITGDELVAMLRERENGLSPAQGAELQRRLTGRRLTFHKGWVGGASGGNDGWTDVSLRFGGEHRGDGRREVEIKVKLREPMKESPSRMNPRLDVTATVLAPDLDARMSGEGLMLGDAVLE